MEHIDHIIQHENENWSRIFEEEIQKNSDKKYSSYWWEAYYTDIIAFLNTFLSNKKAKTILEAGSGSGKATLLLGDQYKKTLLDISTVALDYARHLTKKFNSKQVEFVEGNLFKIEFPSESFDFVWNLGVIEHYNEEEICEILSEMIRVTKKDGTVALGVPNFFSGPILKAWLLNIKLLSKISGYRLDTENFYSKTTIKRIFQKAAEKNQRQVKRVTSAYFGNPLPMETPKTILNTLGKVVSILFYNNSFLTLSIFELE